MSHPAVERNCRLLIIDDNRKIHEDFRKILARDETSGEFEETEAALFGAVSSKGSAPAGSFQLDSAYQGMDGLVLVQQALKQGRPYAMAFVDVRMPPGWDGVETTAKIWEIDPDLQIVICTAFSDCSWDEMLDKLGRSDRLVILKKPFDNIEVLQLASCLTRKWQLLQESKGKMAVLEEMVAARTAQIVQEQKDRSLIEVQLRQAQKLESVGQLAAGIAHEINTPIQYIGDNIHFIRESFATLDVLLQDYKKLAAAVKSNTVTTEVLSALESSLQKADIDYLGKEVPLAIQQTLQGVSHVSHIVHAMKEFSHPGSREKEALDINHAIEITSTVARSEWKYVAEMVTDFQPGLPSIRCLHGEFNQAILNLIVNAAHAIGDVVKPEEGGKGTIRISTRLDRAWVEIRISDTGRGIPEEIRHRIFDPFFTTKAVGKGTGQGLAIARSVIVDKHGGTLDFESEMGRGTTFIIRLPVAECAVRKG